MGDALEDWLAHGVDGLSERTVTLYRGTIVKAPNEELGKNGIATLMKGMFSTFSNPAAHAPKVAWATSRTDALDILTLASMLHRRLDKADVRQAAVGSGQP